MHPASQFPGPCDRGFLLPSEVRPTPTSLFQTEFLPALCSQRGVCLLIYHWHAGNSLDMSCNHLSPAIAVWLSSNLSFPPAPPSPVPSSPLPIQTFSEYAHLVQGAGYYTMFPEQPVHKKEACSHPQRAEKASRGTPPGRGRHQLCPLHLVQPPDDDKSQGSAYTLQSVSPEMHTASTQATHGEPCL